MNQDKCKECEGLGAYADPSGPGSLDCAYCDGTGKAASADLIARIVDRDTPPDGRNDVVDHDLRGNPITRGDVEAFSKAASASQSSTPVPRVGGPDEAKTIDTPELRTILNVIAAHGDITHHDITRLSDYFLAHVARQRQESVVPSFDCSLASTDAYDPQSFIDGAKWAQDRLVTPSAAVAEGVDTVILQRLVNEYTHACEMVRGHAIPQWRNIVGFVTHACAQQREAGRREQMDRVRLMEGQRDIAQATCREFSKALDEAARARQPVSEGLTTARRAIADIKRFVDGSSDDKLNLLIDDDIETLEKFLAAVPPAKPVPMILHCPACGLQHIDAPESDAEYQKHLGHGGFDDQWTNPPHRSHLCRPEDGGCGHIWRPADVPTEGVAAIQTRGSNDSAAPPAKAEGLIVPRKLLRDLLDLASTNSAGNPLYHDAGHCEVCGASAPKDVPGELTGPLAHREGCVIGELAAILAQQAEGERP